MTEKTRTYEMLWNCEYCDTKKLLGKTHRFCPECGGPQNPEKRYFPDDSEKVAVEDHVYVGADRSCPACKTACSAAAKCCGECGSPLDGATEVKRIEDKKPAAPAAAPPAKKSGKKKVFIGLAIVAALVGLCSVLTATKEVAIEATGHNWKREISIEKFQTVQESEWCDKMPSDGYDVSRKQEERSTKKIPDGETCRTERVDNGDGTFSEKDVCTAKYREEPVNDAKCYYKVNRWKSVRSVVDRGGLNDPLSWPAVALARTGTGLGAEREGKREEVFTVAFIDPEKKTYSCDFPEAKWRTIAVGSKWNGQANNVTGSLDCESLTPPGEKK